VDECFDRLTRVASHILDVPITGITLLDGRRQFFLSTHGAPEPVAGGRELPLEHSVCRHVLETGEPLLVADARDHELVAGNPVLQEHGLVAYAGVPLATACGQIPGTVCAFDSRPRAWTALDVEALRNIGRSAMAEAESRQATALARDTEARHAAVVRAALDCIIVMDERGRVAEFNPAAEKTFGYPREAALGRPLAELIVPADRWPEAEAAFAHRLADGGRPPGHRVELVGRRADGSELPVELTVTRTELHGRPLLIANVRDLMRSTRRGASARTPGGARARSSGRSPRRRPSASSRWISREP
jgi:PAS domain S-box-containing protein